MNHLNDQLAAQVAKTRQVKPEFMQQVDDLLAEARDAGNGDHAPNIRQAAPTFQLPDAHGKPVALADLLNQGPVVIMFYRGSWCPYCNLQIRALQARLTDIQTLGAELIAISPQQSDLSLSQTERDALEFTVLSDKDCRVAEQYGAAWEVPSPLLDHMRKDRGLDLVEINQGNGSMLPIPATFIVDRDGTIAWRSIDVDYRTRAEPDEVIAALDQLSTSR